MMSEWVCRESIAESLQQVASHVNTARSVCGATLCIVTDDATRIAQGKRLAEARKAAGWRSGRAAALDNGWPESSYRAHEAGKRTIGQDDAERYARRYRAAGVRITAEEILFGPGKERGSQGARAVTTVVPLISWVSAGGLADASSQIPIEEVPLLAFADLGRGDFFALRVQGDSMDRVSPEGSIIIVNRAERQLVAGKPYVFAVRGESTYKIWHAKPDYLAPYSTNPSNGPIIVERKRDLAVIGRVRRSVLDL
jgi:SOS-response transcriptional repressor LexA